MEIIKLRHPYMKSQIPSANVVLALGFFDGVHRGHQEVINQAKQLAVKNNHALAVMTFNQHPSIVFKKVAAEDMLYLSTVEKKEAIMADLGVDTLYEVEFTSSFASLDPQTFVDLYIVGLNAKVVVAGFDYTYGKKEIASMKHLPQYAENRFDIVVIEKQTTNDAKISSTRIRKAIDSGNVEEANDLLGYTYEATGRVIHGDARGRLLGFPTANIDVTKDIRLPTVGVYVVEILVGNERYQGMASIGHNITFEKSRPLTVEVYILDFNQNIYGEKVTVFWLHYLRSEWKFDSVEALITQLKKDEEDTRQFFQTVKN
ncbi:riboflavin kinase / FMN adenylyltransferase [Carnobacterium iners]|uniref:Riboflavin biosynthesis protein n=1 Tax=Carnobacterium iners TaxID=1073423 RepID=A0A1X7NGK6_9LACT|nr:riboflavin biosynthesis protein RibF [Carnobacterium iners]SEK80247.1 riboflavin kinase / FMN adenylyltransferase [Carnobacterium iners]SMH36871.1 riboflavin kinase / FMN adenylyltransferase [Carnobacterium iners]